jgi:hypothetical protein
MAGFSPCQQLFFNFRVCLTTAQPVAAPGAGRLILRHTALPAPGRAALNQGTRFARLFPAGEQVLGIDPPPFE